MEIFKILWSWPTFAIFTLAMYHKEFRVLLTRIAASSKAKIGAFEIEMAPTTTASPTPPPDLEIVENQKFIEERITLDNKHFKNCIFEKTIMVYSGTGPVGLTGCNFFEAKWQFEGPAQETLKFLAGLYHGAGEGGKILVETTFNNVRQAPTSPPTA